MTADDHDKHNWGAEGSSPSGNSTNPNNTFHHHHHHKNTTSIARVDRDNSTPTTEFVLNFAFLSFVGFMAIQAVFALIAHSESMLADSEAMSVDAVTYLCNLAAERFKHHNRPHTTGWWCGNNTLHTNVVDTTATATITTNCQSQRNHFILRRLYLELIPPALSVLALLGVTLLTLHEAWATLTDEWQYHYYHNHHNNNISGGTNMIPDINDTTVHDINDNDDIVVSVPIMLFFSAANLLLDIVNVTCFARSGSAFGLLWTHAGSRSRSCATTITTTTAPTTTMMTCTPRTRPQQDGFLDETSRLLPPSLLVLSSSSAPKEDDTSTVGGSLLVRQEHNVSHSGTDDDDQRIVLVGGEYNSNDQSMDHDDQDDVNMNMCSAWTHICADTMRSAAVLLAAGMATAIPTIRPVVADSVAAVAVSLIILVSLLPLVRGLIRTASQIVRLHTYDNTTTVSNSSRRMTSSGTSTTATTNLLVV